MLDVKETTQALNHCADIHLCAWYYPAQCAGQASSLLAQQSTRKTESCTVPWKKYSEEKKSRV